MGSIRAPQDKLGEGISEVSTDELSLVGGRHMGRRWPTWAIALGLLAVVLLVLGGAFFLNSRLKPKVGTESLAAGATPLLSAAQPSSAASVAVPTPSAGTSSGPSVGQLSATSTGDGTQAISQAYLHYWDVYNSALLTLDPSRLSDVSAEDELTRDTQSVEQLRSGHKALQSDVTHHLEVTSVSPDAATIHDQFEDRSYLIDPITKQPLATPQPATTETIACQLKLIGGVWKVVDVVKVAVTVVHS